jgi:amino acid adenylation domain-containing protein
MPLMAAFAATLQRTSGQDDIVVGTPIANRTRSELEDLIGFFVNNLVMRADLSGNPTLRELLARVKETTLAAYEHQDLPFEWLVHELQRDRDPNRNPIFQVMFALQNAPLRPLELGDLTIKVLAPSRNTRFDIEGHAYRSDHGLTTIFIYDRDLFTPATIRRMLDHFRTMLETLVRDGRQRVGTVPLLTDAQRQTIVSAWNRTTTAYPKDQSVPALFARQCQRTPEAPALKFDDATLTYAELNARANQIAHALRRRGVKTGVMVGIFAERGADMVVGLVGILKAGGVYVPLDPEYPPGRLAFMLEETRASVLLTHASVGDAVPGYAGSILCFDRDHAEIAAEPAHDLASPDGGPRATDLAYVIYTSGSTGGPKGVCVEHRSIARLVCDTDYVELGPADRVAQGSNASFDAATFEIWGALLNGATLVGLTRDEMLAPQVLARRLREEGITTLFLTTALFNQTVRMAPEAFASLRTLLFGGELVDPAQVRTVLRDGPPERLLHVYGPTETTTFATWHDVREVADDAVTVPIGRPLANTTTYVLDAHGQPVPVGLPGELCIGGDGVARGYLDHTHATADCFVPDPFSGDPGARLYRTGDWVRYDADGAIAFIGRHDGQVKLRGFRIEVGEIESAIVRQPLVRSAVVMVREDEPGDKRLVAYVVPERDDALSVDELRRGLRSELPRYMVPMAFVVMDDFPLTPNGKVDRGALPVPDPARAESEGEYVAPRSDVERSLAEIWASVLRLDRVGVHDDFFGLGGHSLMATQVVSRLRTELGVDLPLQTLFEHPTVAALAEEIETVGWLAGDDITGAFTGDVEEGTL